MTQVITHLLFIDPSLPVMTPKLLLVLALASNIALVLPTFTTKKSSINAFQRHSYGIQKGRPLTKPFICSTTTGHIIHVWEPFSANSSDGSILPHLLNFDESLSNIIESGDIFILDRGFRNCVSALKERGIKFLILVCKKGQLSSSEANKSRFCTKLR